MEDTAEFEIGDKAFRVMGLMEPRKAFHVARRLMPLSGAMKDLLPIAMQLSTLKVTTASDLETQAEAIDSGISLLEPIAQYLSRMPEIDADYVIDACLDMVQFKTGQDKGWVKIATGGQLMFQWITMPMMIRMVVEVVRLNLTAFFPGLLGALSAA